MDTMNLLGLACAVLAALAFGVLLAYTVCQGLFALLRIHARSLHSLPPVTAPERQVQVHVPAS